MKFVSKHWSKFVAVLIGSLLGHFISNANGVSYYVTVVYFALGVLLIHLFVLRANKINRWKAVDDIRNPGIPFEGKEMRYRGGIWAYWPKGYKFGVGHPWYKPKNKQQEEEKDEDEKQDKTE